MLNLSYILLACHDKLRRTHDKMSVFDDDRLVNWTGFTVIYLKGYV